MRNLSQTQRAKVEKALGQHEYFRHAYFWTPPTNASGRRWMEKKNSWGVGFKHEGVRYEYVTQVRCSGKYVRYAGRFYADGERVTVRKFKALQNNKNKK